MIGRAPVNMVLAGLVLALALAAAVAANIALLGVASGPKDPVGRLSPRAGLVQVPVTSSTTTAPTTSPTTTSDDSGRETHADD